MSTPESADQPLHVTKPVDINKLHIEEIDPYGDLILHVGADLDLTPRTFKVDSSALRRGSPVFKKMLFGPWVEAKPPTGERWLVSLPEDNPDALELILQIAHCQFSSAQKERMTPERVYDLFLVSDKYGMAPLLAPWIHWWGKFARHSVYQTQFAFDWGLCPFRGFIAWEVGLSEEFRFHLYHVVNTCRIDPKSNVLVFDGDQGKEMPVSQYRLGPVDMDGEHTLLNKVGSSSSVVLDHMRFVLTGCKQTGSQKVAVRGFRACWMLTTMRSTPESPTLKERPCRLAVTLTVTQKS
ncbi:hypothetical protein QBC41DRAFT_227650 [Cercophora samala]|uniref:BTB domain-containing protein n=1 Tax=Cercophora samala TaxID=330535 RepID=A0AA39ZCB5_9PEZI|nr:hypothetical protein QBC41DRAFT_227650 [Cercophora samala]